MTARGLIFILGLPRSGTHLLRFALDKSDDVAFVPETAILYKYWGSRWLGRLFGRRFLAGVLARSMVTGHGDPTMAGFTDREAAIAAAAAQPPTPAAIADVLAAFFPDPPRYLGEKSPNNTLHLRDMLAGFPPQAQLRAIFIERDPHDQIASSVRTRHIGGGLAAALARHGLYHSAIAGLDVYRLRYEDLVLNPEPTLRPLCDHLGIAFRPEMLRPGVRDSSEGESFFEQGDIGFVADSIGKGRERLGPEAAALVDAFLARGPAGLPLRLRMQVALRRLAFGKNRALARLGVVMTKQAVSARIFGRAPANPATGSSR